MKRLFSIILFIASLCSIQANTFFISPNGNDSLNNGTLVSPWSTIMRAQKAVEAGDTVYLRGGKYIIPATQIVHKQAIWSIVHLINKSGKVGNRIKYWAYKNEKPVFDLSLVKPVKLRVMVFKVTGSWIHFKGIEVIGTQVTIQSHTQSECFHNEGSNNIYEQLSMHDGQAIGFYLIKGSDNLILNCDAYRNYDYTSEGGKGGNTDGFGCHPQVGGKGNVFRGCRAWFNSDDGFDLIRAYESVKIENCWAFYNGYFTDFRPLADGNGFKAGGWGNNSSDKIPTYIPMHTIQFCMAVRNRANGFYANHHIGGNYWYNNTAYLNGTNYNMLNRNVDNITDVPGYNHVLKNNLSFEHRIYETQHIDSLTCDIFNNSFTMSLKLMKADFVSLNQSLLVIPRNADGSLPDTKFLKPKNKGKVVDIGLNIGFPFKGKAPDLGAFEQ